MKKITLLIICFFLISGCVSMPETATVYPSSRPKAQGVYHRVASGESLWLIAKAYRTEINKITRANRLKNPSEIIPGQMLFIPNATQKIKICKENNAKISKSGFMWPIRGKVVSRFGQKKHNIVNKGIDILSEENASVLSSGGGLVSFCDDKVKGFGKTIIINHDNEYSTVYAYNMKNFVKAGQRVKKGQVIAKVGKNPRSGEYMLHFEIRKHQEPKNPFYYLP